MTKEDYKFYPLKVDADGVMTMTSKQTNKSIDVRMVAIDIAYLSDSWNRLDFFVVWTSWITVILETADVELPFKTSSLRALRVMRVLRSMRFFSGIRTILSVLGQSVGAMGNIVGFLVFVYVILGIIGVQMFRGRMQYRCSENFPGSGADTPWGWDLGMMGIGDPNGPSSVFPDAPFCYPELDTNGLFIYDQCKNSCPKSATNIYLPSHEPGLHGRIQWTPGNVTTGMFGHLDNDNSTFLDNEEVKVMLNYMGMNAPRDPTEAMVDASMSAMETILGSNQVSAASFQAWWNSTTHGDGTGLNGPCIPCYVARSCQNRVSPNNETLKCYKFGNPGFNNHGFDHIMLSWNAIFIMMTNLYWWETAYQLEDVDGGLGSSISWLFGFVIILILSWVTVNMFVAVICDTYSDVTSQEAKYASDDEEDEDDTRVLDIGETPAAWADPYAPELQLRSHTRSLARPDEKPTAATDLNAKMLEQDEQKRRLEKSKRVIRYNTGGKLSDGSADIKFLVLADVRPWYVDFLYGPPNPDGPNPDGEGTAPIWRSPTKIMLHPWFDNTVMLFILFNTITLSWEHYGMSTDLINILARIGDVFNAVFVLEMLTKWFGMGIGNYLAIPFNCLDCFIVMTSVLNYFGNLLPGAGAARLLRVFRLFRIARVIRMLYK